MNGCNSYHHRKKITDEEFALFLNLNFHINIVTIENYPIYPIIKIDNLLFDDTEPQHTAVYLFKVTWHQEAWVN